MHMHVNINMTRQVWSNKYERQLTFDPIPLIHLATFIDKFSLPMHQPI
jgi:hypothetical protein